MKESAVKESVVKESVVKELEAPAEPAPRAVLLVLHSGRPQAIEVAHQVVTQLAQLGIVCRALSDDIQVISEGVDGVVVELADPADPGARCELVVVLGGDGTILKGADYARLSNVPLLGVNLGHVGFLAESERRDLSATVERIASGDYLVEARMSIDVVATCDGDVIAADWALNEVTIEKSSPQRMLDVLVEVDARPLSRWGADGVICATPTGSTAYAFSAGGPVVWPEVEALLLVPISAHALFAKPLVVAPSSVLAIDIQPTSPGAVLSCDGRRTHPLPPSTRVEVRRGSQPVLFARMQLAPFTDRLVAKFELPVQGWRRPPQ